MKKTNSKEFNQALKNYLIPIIESKADDYHVIIADPFAWIVKAAKDEVEHEFNRKGEQEGLSYWLSGLALNIDYNYCDIIKVNEMLHDCKLTEKEQDMVCERWFDFLSGKILQYSRA